MALTADANISTVGPVTTVDLVVDAADTFYRGSIVSIDTGGGVHLTSDDGDRVVGISPKQQVLATGDMCQVIVWGAVWMPLGSAVTAADEGDMLVMDTSTAASDDPGDLVAAGDITLLLHDCVVGQIMRATATQMLIFLSPGITGRNVAATITNLWT